MVEASRKVEGRVSEEAPQGDIRIVLIDPQHPGNIGAVARAMKAMALHRLYLVRPEKFPAYEAERRATGAVDVLERAIVVQDAAEALGDCRLVIGSSARTRSHPLPIIDARDSARRLLREATAGAAVAAIFGPERTGLANEDLDRCNFQLRIPTSHEFSSLNLASAVQLLSYEILMASRGNAPEARIDEAHREYPSQSDLEFFYEHLEHTLDARRFTADSRRPATHAKLRRLFGRARPAVGELKMLHSLVRLMHREPDA
jgi:tRNA (cytidine32/uridine32-2'-O)-methyltransferase